MTNSILLQDVKVGQKFYLINRNGIAKYNGKMTMEMTKNSFNGIVEFTRLENDKAYSVSTYYSQYVVIL